MKGTGGINALSFYGKYIDLAVDWRKGRKNPEKSEIRHKYLTKEFIVWDPHNFVQGSLNEVASSWGLPLQKLDYSHKDVQEAYDDRLNDTNKDKDSWTQYIEDNYEKRRDYNNRDVDMLDNLTDALMQELKGFGTVVQYPIDPYYFPTLPALCYSIVQKCQVFTQDDENLKPPTPVGANGPIKLEDYAQNMAGWDKSYNENSKMYSALVSNLAGDQYVRFNKAVQPTDTRIDDKIRKGIIAGRVSSGLHNF